jgi:hypothetical protein
LINGDNGGGEQSKEDIKELIEKTAKENEYKNLSAEADLNKKRWMFAYNALPSNRKTIQIKSLETDRDYSLRRVPMAHAVNYINFDETVRDTMNAKGDGTMLSRLFGAGGAKQSAGDGAERLDVPGGTELIGSEKFIRFGALMKIFNTTIADAYKIADQEVKLAIDSSNCICCAYPNIFSTRKDKLFIPNPQTPKFDFISAQTQTQPITEIPTGDPAINSVTYDGITIEFPNPGTITDGETEYGSVCYSDSTTVGMSINKGANEWGFLDDLYVNFEFASEILSTSNLNVKDALYQILNGMSSAVNDLWNFQILEKEAPANNTFEVKEGSPILSIADLNFNYIDDGSTPPYEFDLIGTDSIFKESSFNLEMSGMKMNQVIGNRLGNKMGTETQKNPGKLFSEGNIDLVLQEIRKSDNDAPSGGKKTPVDAAEEEELREKNYLNFLGKLGTYPNVELEKGDIESRYDINDVAYVAIYDDAQLLKIANGESVDATSPLLPIRFSFTVNGVSGIKRGDKFKVKGIPDMYYERGFFQVVSVKHNLSGMQWNTEIEGGFRTIL